MQEAGKRRINVAASKWEELIAVWLCVAVASILAPFLHAWHTPESPSMLQCFEASVAMLASACPIPLLFILMRKISSHHVSTTQQVTCIVATCRTS